MSALTTLGDIVTDSGTDSDLISSIDFRAAKWNDRWNRDRDKLENVSAYLHALTRESILADPLPIIDTDSINKALALGAKKNGKKRGSGLDSWSFGEWRLLPNDAKGELASLLQKSEPVQGLVNAIALLPKPGGLDERPITLVSFIYKLYTLVRKSFVTTWDDNNAGFWDDAVKGSSALRAALIRSFHNEIALALGLETATVYFDIDNCYDSIDVSKIIYNRVRLSFHHRCCAYACRPTRPRELCGQVRLSPTSSIPATRSLRVAWPQTPLRGVARMK